MRGCEGTSQGRRRRVAAAGAAGAGRPLGPGAARAQRGRSAGAARAQRRSREGARGRARARAASPRPPRGAAASPRRPRRPSPIGKGSAGRAGAEGAPSRSGRGCGQAQAAGTHVGSRRSGVFTTVSGAGCEIDIPMPWHPLPPSLAAAVVGVAAAPSTRRRRGGRRVGARGTVPGLRPGRDRAQPGPRPWRVAGRVLQKEAKLRCAPTEFRFAAEIAFLLPRACRHMPRSRHHRRAPAISLRRRPFTRRELLPALGEPLPISCVVLRHGGAAAASSEPARK